MPFKNQSKLLSVALITMLLSSCYNGARPENMTVATAPNADFGKYSYNIRLNNAQNDTRWDSRVSDKNFYEALQNSLYSNDLLNDEDPRYELSASIVTLTPASRDFSMYVTSDISYMIRDIHTNEIVVEKTFENRAVATANDETMSISRNRLADERAVGGNIEQFVNYLRR